MNPHPSPSTRFKAGNPGRPRNAPKATPPPSPGPVPGPVTEPAPDPRSIQEQAAARLMDMVNTGSDGDQVIKATRLLMSKDMQSGVKELMARAKREAHQVRMVPLLAMARETIASDFPGADGQEVQEFLDAYAARMEEYSDPEAGGEFFELAVEFGWMTKEKLLADRAAFDAERSARIQAGKATQQEPPPG